MITGGISKYVPGCIVLCENVIFPNIMVSYLQIDKLTKSFGDRVLFADVTLGIYQGDKIGLIAANGAGKTTFLNIIAGKEDYDSGNVVFRNDLRVGYLSQLPPFDPEESALAYATLEPQRADDFTCEDRARQMLYQFRITDVDQTLGTMSGGQVKRVALAKVLLSEPDLLILDEPTNHLDMATKDILKQAIKDFTGTVIVVSHDREFLDGLVEKVYEFGSGKVRECLGGIYEFLEKKKLDSLRELERNNTSRQSPAAPPSKKEGKGSELSKVGDSRQEKPATEPPQRKLTYAEQRERDKMLKRSAKKVEEAEAEISRIEAEMAATEARIATGEVEGDIFDRHAKLNRDLENAMSLWEIASQDHEELSARLAR